MEIDKKQNIRTLHNETVICMHSLFDSFMEDKEKTNENTQEAFDTLVELLEIAKDEWGVV